MNLRPLVIAGMHRSGTSYVASVVRAGGVSLGERLRGADAANPLGHFEDLEFTELHEQMLFAHGVPTSGWTVVNRALIEERFVERAAGLGRARGGLALWGWKDPRNALFLDFWSRVLPDARFIFVYRKPWEVVDSLFRRGDPDIANDPLLAVRAWLEHNERILQFHRAMPKRSILASFEAVAAQTPAFIRLIEDRFDVRIAEPSDDLFDPTLTQSLTEGSFEEQMVRMCVPEAAHLYNVLEENADLSSGEAAPEETIDPPTLAMPLFVNWFGLRALEGNARTLRLRAGFAAQLARR